MRRIGGESDGEQPIASKDRAETFEESDVSLTQNGTRKGDESIEIAPADGDNVQIPNSSDEYGTVGAAGFVMNPNTLIEEIEVTLRGDAVGSGDVYVAEVSTGTEVDRKGTYSGGETVRLLGPFNEGTEYAIVFEGGSGSRYELGGFPITSGDVDVVAGYSEGETDGTYVYTFTDVQAFPAQASGAIKVGFVSPNDIYRWDAATYQASPDGETVEVFIEESTDGGDSWTEIAGPISRGDQIDADPGSRVRFRVELARSDTSNNPTLDAIYRRWVV